MTLHVRLLYRPDVPTGTTSWRRICRIGAINSTRENHGQLLGQEAVDVEDYQALTNTDNGKDDWPEQYEDG